MTAKPSPEAPRKPRAKALGFRFGRRARPLAPSAGQRSLFDLLGPEWSRNAERRWAYFDGETFDPALDGARLRAQLKAVRVLMRDGEWRTLAEIARIVGAPEASVSARLRDLRKDRFGGFDVERRRVAGKRGLFEYRVAVEEG